MSDNPLLKVGPPWVLVADFGSPSFEVMVGELRAGGGVVIAVDGAQATTSDGVFEQFAQAAVLPEYFGRNWPALGECLADLEWLPGTAYVVTVENADRLLEDEPLSRGAFARMIKRVAEEWATAVADGEYWDRPSVPFHVVLDGDGILDELGA
ncbi:barstar family protein [Kribbella sp. NPDC051770]|uniref:barstar family protein n=1 Tax=Kribbella sp. NPDC051770 TaxID=3155413 RepID=UPI00342D8090